MSLSFLLGTPAFAQAIAIDKVLVIVNDDAITLSEYRTRHRLEVLQNADQLAPFAGTIDQRILNRMINDRIKAQVAQRRGMRIADQAVEQAVAFIAQQNNITPEGLFANLAEDGITPNQFRAGVRENRLIQQLEDRVVSSRVVVNEQEIESYLAKHAELIPSEEIYEVSHLFVSLQDPLDGKVGDGKAGEDKARAEYENLRHIRQGILGGRAFAQSAREFSDSPNQDEGGYLGWRRVDQLPQLFVQALQSMDAGAVSEIIQSDSGLHLLKLHDRKTERKTVEQQLLRHILIRPSADLAADAAIELAEELYARLEAGEDFEKLARAHSADQDSGINGGLFGWVNPGDFPKDFDAATRALALNEVSQPLRTSAGFHLVQVLERRRQDVSIQIARKRAQQIIFRRKALQLYENWYGVIRDGAYIEYVDASLRGEPG